MMSVNPTCATVPTNIAAPQQTEFRPGILVVDDDTTLLRLLRTVFTRRGFAVWTAGDGKTALELYRQNRHAVSLVLLDVCMPGLDGPQTLAELRRIDPAVLACFMSGFTNKYSHDELLSGGAMPCIEKPFEVLPLADNLWQLAQGKSHLPA